jgi:hypothetical protein
MAPPIALLTAGFHPRILRIDPGLADFKIPLDGTYL